MNQKLKEKIQEAFASVLPITAIVLILSTLMVPISIGTIVMFIAGASLLIIGMGFFSLGADMAMIPIGEATGIQLTKTKKLLKYFYEKVNIFLKKNYKNLFRAIIIKKRSVPFAK